MVDGCFLCVLSFFQMLVQTLVNGDAGSVAYIDDLCSLRVVVVTLDER